MEWCASTEYNGTCNVVPMTSTPMQRLHGSDGLWATYIGVGGISIAPGTNVSLGVRMRSSTERRSDWCWSAATTIGQVIGPTKCGGAGGAPLRIPDLSLYFSDIQHQRCEPSLHPRRVHPFLYQACSRFNASDVVQLLADLNLADYETVSNDENATALAEGDSMTKISFSSSSPGRICFQKGSELDGESYRLAELGVDEPAALGRHRRLTELNVDKSSTLIRGATKSINGSFYASNQSFVLNANTGALDNSALRYSTIYSLVAMHSSGVTAHLDNEALAHLVPDLWVIDSTNPVNPVWVKARDTCPVLYWNNEPASRVYEVDVCNLTLSHDGSASEFRIWFHVAPHAHAHWEDTADTTSRKIYRTAMAATVALVLNGTASEDRDNGT